MSDQVSGDAGQTLPEAPCSTVPFNEANLDRLEKATLLDGVRVECGEGRSVEVWRVKEEDGYCILIFRPTNDGKISKLMFGLKPPAANALLIALSRHLSNNVRSGPETAAGSGYAGATGSALDSEGKA